MTNIEKGIKLPKKLEKYLGIVKGTPAHGDRVKLQQLTLADAQRDLNINDCYKYIEKSGGADWNLFGHLTVCKMPNGDYELINGQHRLNVMSIVDPAVSEFPAHIIDLTHLSQEQARREASRLFAKMNGVATRNISSEQLFWAEVTAEEPGALHIKSVLERANLQCGKVNDTPSGRKKVKYINFTKCVNLGEEATVLAADLIDRAYPKSGMNDNLLSGLTRLLSHSSYPELSDPDNKVSQQFEEWFTVFVPQMMQISELSYQQYRNSSKWYDGVAYGLMKAFGHYQRNKNRWYPPVEPIEQTYKKGFKTNPHGQQEPEYETV